jgi:tRNA pseudouridine38-40 synthase
MQRFKLVIDYDGTPYTGFQRQTNGLAVQQVLEEAFERFAGHAVRLTCAGRTDTGVHAFHQVIHIDIEKDLPADTVRDASNAYLRPHPICVISAEAVSDSFDARRSAIGRSYLYRILDRRAPAGIDQKRVWHVPWRLNTDLMHAAAQKLVGDHDFTTFRASACQAKSPLRTLKRLDVTRVGAEIHIHAASRSFLHHQVRSMTGALKQVGTERWTIDDLVDALQARDRTRCPGMAPSHGLYLIGVDYKA